MTRPALSAGSPEVLGATPDDRGTTFAVFSEHAARVEVCLFDGDGRETARVPLPERSGHIWHGHVAGVRPGALYGLRAHGPFAPEAGHRFNPAKLLIDPAARRLTGRIRHHPAQLGDTPDDSAPHVPQCVVEAPLPPAAPGPRRAMAETVIYEAHVKGLTMRMPGIRAPGSFAGLAEAPVLDHIEGLGITAIELLPVHPFIDDAFLLERGLVNYWGYQPIGFFAPEPRYLASGRPAEFRDMVAAFHARGIEVILDVVFNHSGEGDATGPTLSLRGLDNASYYRLEDGGRLVDDTGCGNTLNLDHPAVLRLVTDSLRYWVETMGVDGFRFDLATTLARRGSAGFDRTAPFLAAVAQDPVLRGVKLIAEPWDIGPGGYQLGNFPAPFAEWNDKFRDGVRRFWRGDAREAPDLAARVTGSARQFDHSGRDAVASVNFVTAHDGFTLTDVVSFSAKHNEANREANRDGHHADFASNHGVEGPSDDPDILAARARTRRNLLATLLLSQGTPMLLAGDEIGNSQSGNNNAYCQDSPLGWVDWSAPDAAFLAFARRLIAFRKAHPVLRQRLFLHSRTRAVDDRADLVWWHPTGRGMTTADWDDPTLAVVCVEMRTASATPPWAVLETAVFAVFNAGAAVPVRLPQPPAGLRWSRALDTAAPAGAERPAGAVEPIEARSTVAFVLKPAP